MNFVFVSLVSAAGTYFLTKNPQQTTQPEKTSKSFAPVPQSQPIRIYTPPPQTSTKTQNIVVASGTALVVLAYYYYSSARQTKIITDTVEETALETQDIVRECDDNNEKRIQELDVKNQTRKDELSSEIRTEARSQFKIVSEQLKLLANISIETLQQVAGGIVRGDDNELSRDEDHGCDLLEVVNNYKQTNEINMSNEAYLQAREHCLKEVQEEISSREKNKKIEVTSSKHQFVTPGGPDDYVTPGGPNDNHEKSFVRNVTDNFNSKNTKSTSNYNQTSYSEWALSKVGGTPYKYYSNARDFYKKHDTTIQLVSVAATSYFMISFLSSKLWGTKNEENKFQTAAV